MSKERYDPELGDMGDMNGGEEIKDVPNDIDDDELDREIEELSRAILPNGEKTGAAGANGDKTRKPIPAIIIIPVWIGLSGCVILLNKYIFSTLKFPYPVFLTAYHMGVATIGTRLLRLLPEGQFERLRPVKVDLPWSTYTRTIVPLALLFSASLILTNIAYVYLSVSFVQMLKAFIPILTLVIQLITRIQEYNHLLLGIILVTSIGCSIAAEGELKFSIFGFICQACAVVVESCRLVLIQILLKDYKMDPLTSISLYAPLCLAMITACIPIMEGSSPLQDLHKVGIPIFILNGLLAFSLNVAGVFLIDSAGSLVLTLSGVFKDILLITFSVLLLGSVITGTQMLGYAIALSAIMTFKLTGGSTNSPIAQKACRAFEPVGEALFNGKSRLSTVPHAKKVVALVTVLFIGAVVHFGFLTGSADISAEIISSSDPALADPLR